MALTEASILEAGDDEKLFKLLSSELRERIGDAEAADLDNFVARLQALPPGLRAMAATYELDVSLTLDDLGWHFANWHHRGYCEETLRGLRELEAVEEAEIFAMACALTQPYWDKVGELLDFNFDEFTKWYSGSALDKALLPLTQRMWTLTGFDNGRPGNYGLMWYWLSYARKYPHKVAERGS